MENVGELRQDFRDWILVQDVEGCTFQVVDDGSICVCNDFLNGRIAFYEIDGACIVEMRVERSIDAEPVFFLHFDLTDLVHAHALFADMAQVMYESEHPDVQQILLCCTCGMTTGFFAIKLNEAAGTLGLGYEFSAKSVEEAKERGREYAAVLLAPQVGYQRKEISGALPGMPVIELPGKIFGSYDAMAALRLVVDALSGGHAADEGESLQVRRGLDKTKKVLALSYVHRVDEATIAYRVLDGGEITATGRLIRHAFGLKEIKDLTATLLVSGYRMSDFDAVGVAIEDLVRDSAVSAARSDEEALGALRTRLEELWGVPVFFDYNATAAAVGCYMSQTEFENVAFHAQVVGMTSGAEGYVVDGRALVGRGGRSGHLGRMAEWFSLSMDLEDAAWRVAGMRELVARYLANLACTIAPDVVYVWCDLLPDMDELKEELASLIPKSSIPKLVDVADFDDCALTGELALCLRHLQNATQ